MSETSIPESSSSRIGPASGRYRGGSHPGLGTHNALISLGIRSYLEILAPDPAQDNPGGWDGLVERLHGFEAPRLVSWIAQTDDLDGLVKTADEHGFAFDEVMEMSRQKPDGSELRWRLAFLKGYYLDAVVPGFIEWAGASHPSQGSPPGCRALELTVETPDPDATRKVFEALALDVPVIRGPAKRLAAVLDTPKGRVVL